MFVCVTFFGLRKSFGGLWQQSHWSLYVTFLDQVHLAPRQDKAQKAKLIYLYPPHLVEVADGHRGKVNLIERAGGRAGGDDWGLLEKKIIFSCIKILKNVSKYFKIFQNTSK